ncbi:Ornithine cyclodeaminase [Aduncisulcus paluster]|uniref:Ornithine cyclodeaminase n=1 Tax=Aduncisulcus paluster TaxID=2918883 RepID=A0ABQ5JVQ2_9EUKA|nr:Ornithine cyclodeaminase [Aduncisulcus paluster]
MSVKILSAKEVFSIFPMKEAVEQTEKAFKAYTSDGSQIPLRSNLHCSDGDTLFMPGTAKTEDMESVGIKVVSVRAGNRARGLPTVPAIYMDLDEKTGMLNVGIKVVSVRAGNRARGLPTVPAIYMDLDEKTGMLKSLIDGVALTYLRTGAASGVAAKYLARSDSKVLFVCGCGMQGKAGTEAILCVRPGIEKIYFYDSYEPCAKGYQQWLEEKYPKIEFEQVPSPNLAVPKADIILTATTSKNPVFDGYLVKPGTHISGVGAYTPEMQEIPSIVVKKATCIADTLDGCLSEAGDFIRAQKEGLIGKDHVKHEIGEIILGKVPGRQSELEITFFKTVGSGVQDVVVGAAIGVKAASMKAGFDIEF